MTKLNCEVQKKEKIMKIDVISITAHKCMHCGLLFEHSDEALEHLDSCYVYLKAKYSEKRKG